MTNNNYDINSLQHKVQTVNDSKLTKYIQRETGAKISIPTWHTDKIIVTVVIALIVSLFLVVLTIGLALILSQHFRHYCFPYSAQCAFEMRFWSYISQCLPTLHRQVTNSLPTVGRLSANCRPTILTKTAGCLSVVCRPTAGRLLVDSRLIVG